MSRSPVRFFTRGVAFLLLLCGAAEAAVRTVTNLNDSGSGSLRNMIAAAASGDIIQFAVTGTISLTSGELVVDKDLTVSGPGARSLTIRVIPEFGSRIFSVRGTVPSQRTVTVSGIAISGGASGSQTGAGIDANYTKLLVQGCEITGNRGAGISVSGADTELTVRDSTISGNTTSVDTGSGILCLGTQVFLSNCTIADNRSNLLAVEQIGLDLHYQQFSAVNCTFVRNSLKISGDPTPMLGGCIFEHSSINRFNNPSIVSLGYNLSWGIQNVAFTATGDQVGMDPRLDSAGLQDNGGPVRTIALTSGSPALDKGFRFGLTADQRGQPRPVDLPGIASATGGDGSDIGAYEAADPVQPGPSLIVTTMGDHDDGTAGAGDCTLREAIRQANAVGNGTAIIFAPGLTGTLALDRNLGSLKVTGSTSITGPGARLLTVSAGGYMRVFTFAGSASRTLSGLTISDGSEVGAPRTAAYGAGIFNDGTLTLSDCTLQYHSVRGGVTPGVSEDGVTGEGGGIYNNGSLTLNRCTFRGCLAGGAEGTADPEPNGIGGNGGSAAGGAVYHNGILLTINSCTFQGNSASGAQGGASRFGGGGGSGRGGAVFNNGPMTVTASTFSGNVSQGGRGGAGFNSLWDGPAGIGSGALTGLASGVSTVRNTLIAGNLRNAGFPSDVDGEFTSGGYNLIGTADGSTGFTTGTDQKGTNAALLNPMLGSLQNNGGQIDTMLPMAGSPAIDKGRSFGIVADPRGVPRPIDALSIPNASGGDGSDIGALETDGPQSGPDFVVNSLDDHDDGSATYLDCTLREALNAAFFAAGADTVMFQPGLTGIITLNPALGSLTMYDSMTLIGPGARRLTVQRESGVNGRILLVQGGPHAISGLTLTGGTLTGNTGGQSVQGAGILTQGVLTVSDCTISRNIATGGDNNLFPGQPGGSAIGGGVANLGGGILTLNRCSLALNSVYGGRGFQDASSSGRGGDASGGAVFNDTGCTLTIVNCTFNDNAASGGNSGNANSFAGVQGGAGQGVICNRGTMTLTAATLRGGSGIGGASGFTIPRGAGAGGILAVPGSSSLVRNTLCAANIGNFVPSDIGGAFTSGGFNLIGNGDTGTGFTAAGDQQGTTSTPINARFGVFFNYGGPTDTVGLLPDSTALDRGKNFGLGTDQRGAARTYDDPALSNIAGSDGTDIGAFETVPAYSGPPVFTSSQTNTLAQFQLQGEPFVSYQLQSSDGLSGAFSNTGAPKTSDGLGLLDFTDPGPLPERRFYKVIRTP